MLMDDIKAKIGTDNFEFSQHALDQSIVRSISVSDLREAVDGGEIIEDYPQDKYGPSCLILGFTALGRPLHIQCSYPIRPVLKVITLYEPAAERWFNFRLRRT